MREDRLSHVKPMKCLRSLGLAAVLSAAIAPVASPHSLKDLETMLGDREKYFQPIAKEAPGFSLQNAEGRAFTLDDFQGKVVVLHFIYAGCPDVCPLHADRIAEVQSMVNGTPMKEHVQFVTITTDPKNDSPDVLRGYGALHGLDRVNWVFLTTTAGQPEDATRKLAEQFGHKFMKQKDGYQIHGIVTHVVDREGRWRANFHGLKFEPANLVVFVNALVNDVHAPRRRERQSTWDRLKKRLGF